MDAALHLIKYLAKTISFGIFYPIQQNLPLATFSDADWASSLYTWRSTSRFCVFLGHSLISWKTKKQPTVLRSSTEFEYHNMAATTVELLWLSYLLQDLHVPVRLLLTLFCDNKSAQLLAVNPCFHDKLKHFAIDYHFTRKDPGWFSSNCSLPFIFSACGHLHQVALSYSPFLHLFQAWITPARGGMLKSTSTMKIAIAEHQKSDLN